jgi:hypothetical protein
MKFRLNEGSTISIQTLTQMNRVNVDQLVSTINANKTHPDLAQYKFRATTNWVNGDHSRTIFKSFSVPGSEDSSRTAKRMCGKDIIGD